METELTRKNTILSTDTTFIPTLLPNPCFTSEYKRQFTWKNPTVQPPNFTEYTPESGVTRDQYANLTVSSSDESNRNRGGEDASLRQEIREVAGNFERERERERQTGWEGHAEVREPTVVRYEDVTKKVRDTALDKDGVRHSMERGVHKDDVEKGPKTEEENVQRKVTGEQEKREKDSAKGEERRLPTILSYGHANRWPKVKELDMKTFNHKVPIPKTSSGGLSRRDVEKYRRLTQNHPFSSDLHPSSPVLCTKCTQTPSSQYATEYRQHFVNWFRDPVAVCWSNWTCGPDGIPRTLTRTSASRPLQPSILQLSDKECKSNLPPPAGIRIDGIERLGRMDHKSRTTSTYDYSGESEFGPRHFEKRHYPLRPDSLTIQIKENLRDAAEESIKLSKLQDRLRALRECTPEPRATPTVLIKSQEIANPPPLQQVPVYPPPASERTRKSSNAFRAPFASTPEDHASNAAAANNNHPENNMSGPTLTNFPTTSDGQRILMYNCEPPTTYNLAQELLRRAKRRQPDVPYVSERFRT